MINLRRRRDHVVVTFSLDDDRAVSVVGDFNRWDPLTDPLLPRSTGLRSAVVAVPPGSELRFRYLADGGDFFDDPDVEVLEDNGFGGGNGVLRIPG